MTIEQLYAYQFEEEIPDGDDLPDSGTNPNGDETPDDSKGGEKLFTQADIEKIIGERLVRERKQAQEKADKERLLEDEKYKDLYEKSEQEKADLLSQVENEKIDRKKTELIVAAGYDPKQFDFIRSILHGNDEAELIAALDVVKENVPPVSDPGYADPSLGNGFRAKPTPKKDSEYGKELYDRIRKK